MSFFFPNPKPNLVDDLWFKIDHKVDEDVKLAKEEEEFRKMVTQRHFYFDLGCKKEFIAAPGGVFGSSR